jgi:hypothetical protein
VPPAASAREPAGGQARREPAGDPRSASAGSSSSHLRIVCSAHAGPRPTLSWIGGLSHRVGEGRRRLVREPPSMTGPDRGRLTAAVRSAMCRTRRGLRSDLSRGSVVRTDSRHNRPSLALFFVPRSYDPTRGPSERWYRTRVHKVWVNHLELHGLHASQGLRMGERVCDARRARLQRIPRSSVSPVRPSDAVERLESWRLTPLVGWNRRLARCSSSASIGRTMGLG